MCTNIHFDGFQTCVARKTFEKRADVLIQLQVVVTIGSRIMYLWIAVCNYGADQFLCERIGYIEITASEMKHLIFSSSKPPKAAMRRNNTTTKSIGKPTSPLRITTESFFATVFNECK